MSPLRVMPRPVRTIAGWLLLAGLVLAPSLIVADSQRMAVEQRFAVAPPPAVEAKPAPDTAPKPPRTIAVPFREPAQAVSQPQNIPQPGAPAQPAPAGAAAPESQPVEPRLDYVEALRQALLTTPTFRYSQLDIELARLQERDTWYKLFPKLNLSASYDKPLSNYSDGTKAKSYMSISFTSNQYDPIGAYIGHDASKIAIELAKTMHLLAVQKLMEQAGQAVIMVDSYDKQSACRKEMLALARELAENTAQRRQSGSLAPLDQRLAELKREAAQKELDHSMRQRTQELAKFKRILGLDPADRAPLDLRASMPQVLGEGEAYVPKEFASVERDNLEIKAMRQKEKLLGFNVRLAQAEHLPKFNLGLRTPDPTATNDNTAPYYATLSAAMPLWHWGEIERGVDRARLKGQQLLAANAQTVREMRTTWETAGTDIELLRDKVGIAATTAELRALEAKRKEIMQRTGSVEYEVVNEAKSEAIRARLSLIKAQEEYALARLKLRTQSGELFNQHMRVSHDAKD